MNVICLGEDALLHLIDKVVEHVNEKHGTNSFKWVSGEVAMEKLGIGKATLQKFRDERLIRFTQPFKKIILYDMDSINEYLEKNARNPNK